MKRIFIVLLVLIMCAAMFACASERGASDSTSDQSTPASSENPGGDTSVTDTVADYLDRLPDADYGNTDFNILIRTNKKWEMYADDINGQTVNDAVYNRNLRVAEKYKVRLNMIDVAGDWNNRENFKKTVTASVLANDGMYDLVAGYMAYVPSLAVDGNFLDLNCIDTIDMSNVWWADGFVENNTVNGKLFYAVGDISLTMWDGLFSIFFNKDMAESHGVGNLYDAVRDKAWTLEKMLQLSTNIYSDSDSNADKSGGDTFGFVTYATGLRPMVYTSGLRICQVNDDGTAAMTLNGEKYINLYNTMYQALINTNDSFYTSVSDGYKVFSEQRALFYTARNWDAESLRQLEVNFGILPFPLYDEAQENYISVTDDACSMFSVVTTAKNPEMSGRLLEALSAESASAIIPEYYDSILKYRNTTDEDSALMLDLLRETLFIDFGYVHSNTIGGPFQFFSDALGTGQASITGVFKAQNISYQKKLDQMMQAYSEDK